MVGVAVEFPEAGPKSPQAFRITRSQSLSMSSSSTSRRYFATKTKCAWSAETTCLPRL